MSIPFDIQNNFTKDPSGTVKVSSPSNIALVKYWGKYHPQLPANPSISFTLSESKTITQVDFCPKEKEQSVCKYLFEGKHNPTFENKIAKYLQDNKSYLPFVEDFDFHIQSENTFPHSSGIASSASAFSALAKALVEIESQVTGNEIDTTKISFLARLGSGSACRSVYGPLACWGKTDAIPDSSDEYAIPYPFKVHKVFDNFHDTILLIHEGAKKVSSTVGHELMNNHPYAERRFEQAHENMAKLVDTFTSGDLDKWGEIVEQEALTLHAMMMTSLPYFILMKPNTLACIEKIWEYRQDTQMPLYFTLDAGANIHVLYPDEKASIVQEFIQKELVVFTEKGNYISDKVGYL